MHKIFGERFLGVRKPAWHKIGKVIPEPVPVKEALVLADLDYEVTKAPLSAWLPGGTVGLDKWYATVIANDQDLRESNVLGIVSKDYVVLQNRELAELLEPVNKKWPVETAGALRNGAVTWFLLNMKKTNKISGEDIENYLLCSTGHDGQTSVNIALTRTRVVCWNTWTLALDNSAMNYIVKHQGEVKKTTKEYLDLILQIENKIDAINEQEEQLSNRKITDSELNNIIDKAYPMPKARLHPPGTQSLTVINSELYLKEKVLALRNGASDMHVQINDEYPYIANTAWSAFQAITEISNWRSGPVADRSVMFGVRKDEMNRGYAAALELIK